MALPPETNGNPPRGSGDAATSRPSSGRRWVAIVACVVIAAAAGWWWHSHPAVPDKQTSGAARGELPPVPVVAGVVAEKDVPIYLDGLGIVQAFNTVTIHVRVDGQLQKVAFVEGQEIVTKISLVPRSGQDKPHKPVVLESVLIDRVG